MSELLNSLHPNPDPVEANPILRLENVSAGYDGRAVVKDVQLSVSGTDFIGMIGPNGGGKTTLLKTILGLIKPFSGAIRFFEKGREVHYTPLGYLPQVSQVDRKFPIQVMEVVASGLASQERHGFFLKRSNRLKVMELMERVGIQSLAQKPIGELSGGQMQRALLARAIISRPRLLILDEPSTYVDSSFEKELYQILDDLNKEMAILLVSHDIGMVAAHVKSIACVNGSLQMHYSNLITTEMMEVYNCPIEIISHGHIPHRVLDHHHVHNHEESSHS